VIHHEESVEEMAKMIFLEKESLYMRGWNDWKISQLLKYFLSIS
jgi:hypothetical protein